MWLGADFVPHEGCSELLSHQGLPESRARKCPTAILGCRWCWRLTGANLHPRVMLQWHPPLPRLPGLSDCHSESFRFLMGKMVSVSMSSRGRGIWPRIDLKAGVWLEGECSSHICPECNSHKRINSEAFREQHIHPECTASLHPPLFPLPALHRTPPTTSPATSWQFLVALIMEGSGGN